jgi:hypothetical protein
MSARGVCSKWPKRCVICMTTDCLTCSHLDNDKTNNDVDNLAWMCWNCHWRYGHGIYPVAIVKRMRKHVDGLDFETLRHEIGARSSATRKANREKTGHSSLQGRP